jgi:hypothetical protein
MTLPCIFPCISPVIALYDIYLQYLQWTHRPKSYITCKKRDLHRKLTSLLRGKYFDRRKCPFNHVPKHRRFIA